jgi:branched-chain amino acid transport system permease protein
MTMTARPVQSDPTDRVGPATSRPDLVRRFGPWVLVLLAVLGALYRQTQIHSGEERVITTIFMFVALAQAWNLIGGFTGYACFGQVVFFGIGGYTTAVLMVHAHQSFWVSLVVSGLVAMAFGALIGLPLLRLRGHYFAIATLGVAEGMREVVTNLSRWTGGGAGITLPTVGKDATTAYLGNDGFYVLFLGFAAGAVAIGLLVSRSKFGFALRAIHQDEDAAGAMGVNTTLSKVAVFALSGFITGVVGAAYAFQQVTIFPARLFDANLTVLMVIMVVLGGSGTVLGPILGAVFLQYVSEYLRRNYTDVHTFILGAIIIVAVILLPQGIVAYARDGWKRREFSLLANVRRYRL